VVRISNILSKEIPKNFKAKITTNRIEWIIIEVGEPTDSVIFSANLSTAGRW
jgi:uncharacterized protein involved in propanediol utilization